jgi:hypothetical protein
VLSLSLSLSLTLSIYLSYTYSCFRSLSFSLFPALPLSLSFRLLQTPSCFLFSRTLDGDGDLTQRRQWRGAKAPGTTFTNLKYAPGRGIAKSYTKRSSCKIQTTLLSVRILLFFAKSTFLHAGQREKKSFFHAEITFFHAGITFFHAGITFFHAGITFFHAAASSVNKSNLSLKKSSSSVKKVLFFTLGYKVMKSRIWMFRGRWELI